MRAPILWSCLGGEGLNVGKVLNLIFVSYTKGKLVDRLLFE